MQLTKKGFTLIETLFSLTVISIIFITFPTLLSLFTKTVFESESKNLYDFNRLNKDIKYSYLLAENVTVNDSFDTITIDRFDGCSVTYTYSNNILDRDFSCPEGLVTDDLRFKIGGLSSFKVEESSETTLKITLKSDFENFEHVYTFTKL